MKRFRQHRRRKRVSPRIFLTTQRANFATTTRRAIAAFPLIWETTSTTMEVRETHWCCTRIETRWTIRSRIDHRWMCRSRHTTPSSYTITTKRNRCSRSPPTRVWSSRSCTSSTRLHRRRTTFSRRTNRRRSRSATTLDRLMGTMATWWRRSPKTSNNIWTRASCSNIWRKRFTWPTRQLSWTRHAILAFPRTTRRPIISNGWTKACLAGRTEASHIPTSPSSLAPTTARKLATARPRILWTSTILSSSRLRIQSFESNWTTAWWKWRNLKR